MKISTILKTATSAAVAASVALSAGQAASAQTSSFVVPVDSIVAGDTGTSVQIASVDVDAAFIGLECIVSVQSLNQLSVHPNNNLLVTTGNNSAEFLDVESRSFDGVATAQPIVVGNTVTVDVIFGDDGFFSGGFDIGFDCSTPIPTTTEPDTPTTTEPAPTTTVPAPTTTDEPPVPIVPDTTTTTTPAAVTTTEPPTSVIPSSDVPTTEPEAPTTTEPGSGDPDPENVLPATGSNLTSLMLGAGFVLAGTGIVIGTRRRPASA